MWLQTSNVGVFLKTLFLFMVGFLALLPMFTVLKDVCKVTQASAQHSLSETSHWNAAAAAAAVELV